jgi:hypothetical protein
MEDIFDGEASVFDLNGVSVLYWDATARYKRHEPAGINLVNVASARLRQALGMQSTNSQNFPGTYIPIGPEFDYTAAPSLFLGRRGYGPLHITWDTNLLLDYFQFGSDLWAGFSIPGSHDPDYEGELEGLQLLIALWVLRDIRFHVLARSISDAKAALSPERRNERAQAFREFVRALQLVGGTFDEDAPSRDGLLVLPESELNRVKSSLPRGADRELVADAVKAGSHVFLTRDRGILRRRATFRPFGLLLASPLDVLENLIMCGAFHCFLAPEFAYWPMPDQQRVGHLISALPRREEKPPS